MKRPFRYTTNQNFTQKSKIKSTLIPSRPVSNIPDVPRESFNSTLKSHSYAQMYQTSLGSTLKKSISQLNFQPQKHDITHQKKNIEDCVDNRIKTLHQWGSRRNLRHEQNIIAHRLKQMKTLKQAPSINNKSKKLFRSISKKKNLNKDIINRFQFYQSQRVKNNIDNIVKTYVQQTKQVPTIKQLLRTNKNQVIDLLRNIRM